MDMVDLLPEQWSVKKDEPMVAQLMPARRRKQVNEINVWLQCFISYVSIMPRHFPVEVMELLAHMAHIHKASLAWVQYDATFWKQAALSGNRRWSCLNASLYSMCFTGRAVSGKYCEFCFSAAHVTQETSLTADDVDVAYKWRMVKSVLASLSGSSQESRSPSRRPMLPDRRDSQPAPEVCCHYNAVLPHGSAPCLFLL